MNQLLEFTELKLDNPGVLKTRLPECVFREITTDMFAQVEQTRKSYNAQLVGHIEQEYQYNPCEILKICVHNMFVEYQQRFNFMVGRNFNFDTSVWVNFQKKHEYNPCHFHDGAVSWVLWVSIPYLLKEELEMESVKNSNYQVASKFQFIYNTLDGGIKMHLLDIDRTWEGCMIMFPSYLKHQVYPFCTSNKMRISMAGNVVEQNS